MYKQILLVAIGGGIGSVARYLLSIFVQSQTEGFFPWGTLAVNLLGCLIIGLLFGLIDKGSLMSQELRLLFAIGLCGGFTTFSTFANENLILLRNGEYFSAFLYSGLSVFFGIALVFIGYLSVNIIR